MTHFVHWHLRSLYKVLYGFSMAISLFTNQGRFCFEAGGYFEKMYWLVEQNEPVDSYLAVLTDLQ